MNNDNERLALVVAGIMAGLFGLYWLGRGLWWIGPKLIFVGLPILMLSLLVSGLLWMLCDEKSEHVTSGIRLSVVNYRNVIVAQSILVLFAGIFILTYKEEVRFNEQGQELGKVIQYSSLHHTYNDFAAAWQKASPYQAQSEEKYKSELFDLWYVELIIFVSLFLGPLFFLYFSMSLDEGLINHLKAMTDEVINELKSSARSDVRSLEERLRTEKTQHQESYRELKVKHNTLESELRRHKAKEEFIKKDQDMAPESGSLDADVF